MCLFATWLCDWNALKIRRTIQRLPGNSRNHPEPTKKYQQDGGGWRWRNFPLPKLSPSKLSPAKPPLYTTTPHHTTPHHTTPHHTTPHHTTPHHTTPHHTKPAPGEGRFTQLSITYGSRH